MSFTNYAFDKYVSQGLSQFTICNAPDISSDFPQAEHWVNNFILNSILRTNVDNQRKPFMFAILRRTQMATIEYESGRQDTLKYISVDRNIVALYFKSLYRFELTSQLLYQAYEYISKATGKNYFTKTMVHRSNV